MFNIVSFLLGPTQCSRVSQALNALNSALMKDICGAAEDFEEDPGIGALVLTGSERAFAGECVQGWNS